MTVYRQYEYEPGRLIEVGPAEESLRTLVGITRRKSVVHLESLFVIFEEAGWDIQPKKLLLIVRNGTVFAPMSERWLEEVLVMEEREEK
jgi:hypothetical protein